MTFFQKVRYVFQISKSPKKRYSKKPILNMKFEFPANTLLLLAGNLNFKFRIVFWNIFFLEIWSFEKRIALSEKKPPLLLSSKFCLCPDSIPSPWFWISYPFFLQLAKFFMCTRISTYLGLGCENCQLRILALDSMRP